MDERPAFSMRHIWLAGEGGREMMDAWRLGGRSIAHGHAMEHLVPKEKYGESNSEFYAFSRGQPCFTHPGVMDHTWQNVHWIAGETNLHAMKPERIPGCTYCRPQIASVGLTEVAAEELGRALRIGRFSFVGNGKAIALGETEGLVKTIFDEQTGELLGAHMIGAEVTELIQSFVVAMNLETTEAELMQTVFAHPTLSEMIHESTLDAFGRALHK